MFTGIVEALGEIARIDHAGDAARITINSRDLDLDDVKLGDSIAVSGPCLTRCADAGRLCEGAAGEGQEWGRQARWGGRRRLGAIRNQ